MSLQTIVPTSLLTKILDGELNLSTDTLNCILVDPTFTFDRDTMTKYSQIGADELETGFGYIAGGQPLTSVAVTTDEELGESVLTCDTIAWAATGGSIGPTKGAVIYDDTHVDKLIVAYISFGENITKLETESLAIYNFKVILSDGFIDDSLTIDETSTVNVTAQYATRQTVRRSFTNYNGRPDFLWGGSYDFANMKEDYVNNAIANNYLTTNYPYQAFDGSDSTRWQSAEAGAGVNGVSWIGIKSLKRNVRAIKFLNYSDSTYGVTSIKVDYSTDDGVTWTTIQTTTVVNTVSAWNELTVAEYAGGNAGLHAIRILANSATSANQWIVHSLVLLYDQNLDVCTTGNAIKYDENASYPATQAFDNTVSVAYISSTNMSTGNLYLGQSGLTSAVKAVRFYAGNAGYLPKEVRLSWKQNVGDSWIDLATVACDITASVWQTLIVPTYSPSGSHYFAIRPTTNCAAQVWQLYELEFYTSISDINITASATDPLTMSLAYGLEDKTIEIDSDITDAWQSLTAGRNNFLFYKKDITTGAVSRDNTPIVPQYGYYFDKSRHSLLHFDGADTSTSIIDRYGHPWTVGGNAQISTTDPLFGSGKLVLDGTADYIRNTTLNICNARLFTFECWWSTSDKTTSYQTILGGGGALYAIATELYYTGGNNYMILFLSSNGSSSWSIASLTSAPISITNGVWYKHIVEFDGYYYRVWHGTETANMQLVCVLKSSAATYSANGIHIGSLYDTSNGFKGAIDEVRITMDSNRYGWSPVAETAAFGTYDADIHYFDINKMKMYKGDDSTGWTEVQRVFVGEAYTDCHGCTDLRNYELNSRYTGVWTNVLPAAGIATVKAHNIGLAGRGKLQLTPLAVDNGYSPGDILENIGAQVASGNWAPIAVWTNRINCGFSPGYVSAYFTQHKANGSNGVPTLASWAYRLFVDRGW